jgi:protein TonB
MKTQNQFMKVPVRKLLMLLPVIAFLAFGFASCGKNVNNPSDPGTVFTEVDELPVFTGGDKEILKFIATNTKYPEEAKKNNITGRVVVKFIVEKDGSVSGVEVLNSVDPLLDAEAVRVVGTLPKFEKPAKKDGKIVRVNYMLPITFALQ